MRNPFPFVAVQAAALAAYLFCVLFGFSRSAAVVALVLPAPLALFALIRSRWDSLLKVALIVAELLLSAASLVYVLIVLAFALSGRPYR